MEVSAVSGAKCVGNMLVYYDLNNNKITRDCSILHTGNGKLYRGICKLYTGGADCWRAEGDVDEEYRQMLRNLPYNDSGVWSESFNFSSLVPSTAKVGMTTTTTLPCPACVCPSYDEDIKSLESTLSQCKLNLDAVRLNNEKMFSPETVDAMISAKDVEMDSLRKHLGTCNADYIVITEKINLYTTIAIICISILIFVVIVWIKYEWIGDPKLKDGFGNISKGKN